MNRSIGTKNSLVLVRFSVIGLFIISLIALGMSVSCYSADQAHAATLAVASKAKNKVISITAKERTAYKRAVAACMDYSNQPNPIVVDISDLKLSAKQAENVWDMIHTNGELFWINCYGDTYTKKEFSLPCYYDDDKIDKMRAQLDEAVAKALKRVGPGMNAATKVHMLHDYVLDRGDYKAGNKTAYTVLVKRKGDCFGFTLAMDVLLRRCGFSVDVALNSKLDHAWNIVKVSGKWYHVDTTWDNGYCGSKYSKNFDWKKRRCHLFLLQSDVSMKNKTIDPESAPLIEDCASIISHAGWRCHHKCTSTKYDFSRDLNQGFYKHCSDYKSIVRSFSKAGIKYRVTGVKKVKAIGLKGSIKSAKAPKTVKYKGVTYNVTNAKAKITSSS